MVIPNYPRSEEKLRRLISPFPLLLSYWFKGRNTAPAVFWHKALRIIMLIEINSEVSFVEKDCTPQCMRQPLMTDCCAWARPFKRSILNGLNFWLHLLFHTKGGK
jgi:hypothetical protein